MILVIILLITLILGVASLFLLVKGSRNEYDMKLSDEDQVKYLNKWRKDHNKL